ncbi:ferroxidase fet3, partial [Coemansia erecta]
TLNISRDGYSTWNTIAVNNAVPIPPVHVTQGDTLVLHVQNKLDTPTSVHAHGIYHKSTDYYDGAEMVTECGIPPGENFTYIIETGSQVGNFWIHAHVHSQYTDGFRTPFVIHEKVMPDTYDEEVLLYFEDWDERSFLDKMARDSELALADVPTAYRTLLINGVNGNKTHTIKFSKGKRYRLRLMSLSTAFWVKFRIHGHRMSVVGKDGVDSQPLEVDGVDLGPGQRYSVIVTTGESDEFNYMFTATLYANFVDPYPGLMPRVYNGLVQYNEDAPTKPVTADDDGNDDYSDERLVWSDAINMQALDRQPLLPVDTQIVLSIKQYVAEHGIPVYTFGDYAFNYSLVPTLFTALSMGDLALNHTTYGPHAQARILHLNESVELLIYNYNAKDHSLHLHMSEFQVVEVGPYGDAVAHDRKPVKFQRAGPAPMRCDLITVRAYSYIRLRFRVERPNVMLFHCHMSHGGYSGLAVTFVAAPDLMQKQIKVPEESLRMCRLQNIKTSGNAAGNEGLDMTGLYEPFL